MIRDKEAVNLLADQAIRLISDDEEKKTLSANIKMMADRDAAIRIANEILKLAGE